MKKAALYVRSSVQQDTQIQLQLDELKEYIRVHDFELYKEYVDKDALSIGDRSELEKMVSDAEDGLFDVVIVTKLNRLSRDKGKMVELVKHFSELDVDCISIKENVDVEVVMAEMMEKIEESSKTDPEGVIEKLNALLKK